MKTTDISNNPTSPDGMFSPPMTEHHTRLVTRSDGRSASVSP